MHSTFLTLFASLAIVTVCRAESYSLKITRPEKVGDKVELSDRAIDQMSQTVTAGGEAVKKEATYSAGSLDATREVLAVNAKGRPTKLKFIVKSLKHTADKDAAPKEILTGGKEVIAIRNGKVKSFTIDGKKPDEATTKALKLVISMGDDDTSLDVDSLFNTKIPRAVGDEWDAGLDEMIKSMQNDMSVQIDPQASSGKIKLERVEKVSGVDCCILTGSITLIPLGMRGMPEGTDLTGSTFKLSLTCPAPVDPASPELGGKMAMTMTIKADFKTPDGGKAKLNMDGSMSREESINPVK